MRHYQSVKGEIRSGLDVYVGRSLVERTNKGNLVDILSQLSVFAGKKTLERRVVKLNA